MGRLPIRTRTGSEAPLDKTLPKGKAMKARSSIAAPFPPTPEQQAFIDAAARGENILGIAYAGCAKTTTLELLSRAISGPACALAFNVKIKKELERRLPSNFEIFTLNGLGHRAWAKTIGKGLKLEERKLAQVLKELAPGIAPEAWDGVRQLVTKAMMEGIVPESYPQRGRLPDEPSTWRDLADDLWLDLKEPEIDLARRVLTRSVELSFQGTISYDDQIYMGAMFGGVFPRFPVVLGDEAQDWSPLNQIQVARCAAGQLIVVGDPKQAIYQFRGADAQAFENIKKLRKSWTELPLATTFRCPKAIVTRQQEHAPGFRAAESNPQGEVRVLTEWTLEDVQEQTLDHEQALGKNSLAILCRNNAPILTQALRLLSQGVGVYVLGRDIGKSLIALSKKICPHDDWPASETAKLIVAWADSQVSLARANERESRVAGIEDQREALLAVLEHGPCKTAGELRQTLLALFSRESGQVTLSTIHRSKGLEWDTVVHLDPWRIPSKCAKSAASRGDFSQMTQEKNLRYVAETRAKRRLFLAKLEDFQGARAPAAPTAPTAPITTRNPS